MFPFIPAAILPPAIVFPAPRATQAQEEARLQLIREFESAYVNRRLESLENPLSGPIRLVYEHSLGGPPDRVSVHHFRSFRELEAWLRSQEVGGDEIDATTFPRREVRSGRWVSPDVFEYQNQGILHNHLYLAKLRFVRHHGRYAIAEVFLYDGD